MIERSHNPQNASQATHTVLGDWGTSRLRLYLVTGDAVIDHCAGPGIGVLAGTPLEALQAALAPWRLRHRFERVVLCGMAGSRNGLAEVPYRRLPAGLEDWRHGARSLASDGLTLTIGAGLSHGDDSEMPDVMRGEETQLFGALRLAPALASGRHLVVLPGTHSKWAHLDDGAIVGFTTFITGELFALLRDHSTLLRAGSDTSDASSGFDAGLQRSDQRSNELTAALFETRSAQLLHGRSRGWAGQFLSGLLIGAEVRAALVRRPPAEVIHLIGEPQLTTLYGRALSRQGVGSVELDGSQCSMTGLRLLAGDEGDS